MRIWVYDVINIIKNRILDDEEGIGVIEVILILLVLVGLVLIFKDQITSLANNIFGNINNQVGGV